MGVYMDTCILVYLSRAIFFWREHSNSMEKQFDYFTVVLQL